MVSRVYPVGDVAFYVGRALRNPGRLHHVRGYGRQPVA